MMIFPAGLSLLPGDCDLGEVFLYPCDVPFVAYNDVADAGAGVRVCVTGQGQIYELFGCDLRLDYQVAGSPSLNGIVASGAPRIVVGNSGTILRKYTDWHLVNSPTLRNLRDVCIAPDNSVSYAVGDSGTIVKSTDLGESWLLVPGPTFVNLYRVDCGEVWLQVFGADMKGYVSYDGGSTWIEFAFYGTLASDPRVLESGPPDIYTSFFIDDSNEYVFGEFGVAFKTSTRGSTWQAGFVPGFNRINTAFFVSRDSGMVAGDNGKISFTTDGGVSWFEDSLASSLTTQNINHIEVNLIDSTAVIVGDSGTVIFVATDSTLLDVSDHGQSIPQAFELHQNYPNPFNPTTTISYHLPAASHVVLKTYNILGQEVATLLDEEQHAGSHEVRWNGQNSSGRAVSSGVYFCRLEARQSNGQFLFASVKKMLLLK
jgi:photosystem II stability/assembly factor-like uncharacterized protein